MHYMSIGNRMGQGNLQVEHGSYTGRHKALPLLYTKLVPAGILVVYGRGSALCLPVRPPMLDL